MWGPQDICAKCRRRSCLFPARCPNLDCDHTRLLDLYHRIDSTKGIRHSYIGSGIRYDLFLTEDGFVDESSKPYLKELVLDHTSGRLKVAPEHTEDHVLQKMGKPSFRLFERLRKEFDRVNREAGTHVGLVPYFISSHPGCTLKDMERLANHPALRGFHAHADDHVLRDVLVRIRPPRPQTGVHGKGYGTETGAEIFFLQEFVKKKSGGYCQIKKRELILHP